MAGEHIKTFAINRSKFRELIHCKGMKVLHSGQDEWQKGKKKKKVALLTETVKEVQ